MNVPIAQPRPSVTKKDIGVARESFTRGASQQLPLGTFFDAMPIPKLFPLVGWFGARPLDLLRTTSGGQVWLQLAGPVDGRPPVWAVFDKEQKYVGRVAAERELRILDADSSAALTLEWDEDGRQVIFIRDIVRRGRARSAERPE